jgi:hypothetical protein
MANTLSGMTPSEFRDLVEVIVEDAVERKLVEMLGDPDDQLKLRKSVQERLLQQRKAVEAGQRGRSLGDVAQELELN